MASKKAIAIVMPEIIYGGAEKQFRLLVDQLDPAQFDITVVVERSYGKADRTTDSMWIVERRRAVRFIECRGLRSNRSNIRRLISAAMLAIYVLPRLIRREFDCVLVYSALGLRLCPLLRLFGIYAIFSERNAADYSRLDLLRKRAYFSSADVIVCNSSSAAKNFLSFGYRPIVIRNAIVVPAGRAKAMRQFKRSTLVVPGRIARVKNQMLVVKALPLLEHVIERTVFAGAVEDADYKRELDESIAAIGWTDRVAMPGHIDNIDELYANCELMILPSLAEGLPNVLLEAMAKGIICLASDIPNNREVIRDERFLFKCDSPDSLAAAVRSVIELDEVELERVRHINRVFVEENYSVEKLAIAYSRLFESAKAGADRG